MDICTGATLLDRTEAARPAVAAATAALSLAWQSAGRSTYQHRDRQWLARVPTQTYSAIAERIGLRFDWACRPSLARRRSPHKKTVGEGPIILKRWQTSQIATRRRDYNGERAEMQRVWITCDC
jgi:hypothetical protein